MIVHSCPQYQHPSLRCLQSYSLDVLFWFYHVWVAIVLVCERSVLDADDNGLPAAFFEMQFCHFPVCHWSWFGRRLGFPNVVKTSWTRFLAIHLISNVCKTFAKRYKKSSIVLQTLQGASFYKRFQNVLWK